jgi:hypothetical protein
VPGFNECPSRQSARAQESRNVRKHLALKHTEWLAETSAYRRSHFGVNASPSMSVTAFGEAVVGIVIEYEMAPVFGSCWDPTLERG